MLRFLSRRKGRNTAAKSAAPQTRIGAESTRFVPNKNLAQCRVILLDGTDLSVDLTVSPPFLSRAHLPSERLLHLRNVVADTSIGTQGAYISRCDHAAAAPYADFFLSLLALRESRLPFATKCWGYNYTHVGFFR
jgi:hypothetical protein